MLTIKQFTFSPVQENTYVIYNEQGWCAIVDPGCYFPEEKAELNHFIETQKLLPKKLLNTHCHLDHVFGNKFVHQTFGLSLHLHELEKPVLNYAPISGKSWGLPFENYSGDLIYLNEGDQVVIGEDVLDVFLTPGHSPGSIVFYCKEQKFVIGGDVLFRESIGRTDLPGGNHSSLLKSIQEKLFVLPDDTVVHSGHGPTTTIGYEKQHNPFLT
ncbi:MAG: MBL fold metallo-hydrolase [Chitinophagaceae bacterium]|nr:MBL fold metallo-hydrolase [Chitinophagaceae bacterium]